MGFAEALEEVRRTTPGCKALVFGDLRTGIVLRSAAGTEHRQEDHDALLAEACRCLGPAGAALREAAFGHPAPPSRALAIGKGEARLFLRAPGAAPEALCAALRPDSDLDGLADRLMALLVHHA
jgi:hypothetical protein